MMMIFRIFLVAAGSITALWISRDALNFGVIETLVAVILIALLCLLLAFWRLRPPHSQHGLE